MQLRASIKIVAGLWIVIRNRITMNIVKHFSRVAALFASALLFCAGPAAHADEMADANMLFKQGQRSQALDKVNGFLAKKPKDAHARFLKGLILTEQGKTADAIRIFAALTVDYPDLPEPYNNLAVLYASQGKYDIAKELLEKAISTHPSYATAHENLGDIYAKMASQAYDRALQLDNSNTATQTKLAMIQNLFAGESRHDEIVAPNTDIPGKVAVPDPDKAASAPAIAVKPPVGLPRICGSGGGSTGKSTSGQSNDGQNKTRRGFGTTDHQEKRQRGNYPNSNGLGESLVIQRYRQIPVVLRGRFQNTKRGNAGSMGGDTQGTDQHPEIHPGGRAHQDHIVHRQRACHREVPPVLSGQSPGCLR